MDQFTLVVLVPLIGFLLLNGWQLCGRNLRGKAKWNQLLSAAAGCSSESDRQAISS